MTAPKKIVLAYSGGLDTSVILPWLKGRYPGVKLVAFAAELGQGDELKDIEKKAYKSGADEVVVKDLRKEFAEDYCFPMLRAHATYEADYLLGTSIARPLIARHQVLVAHQTGADAVGHGATGKGNDQVRFELTSMALDPTLAIISPWKDPQFLADGLNDRETAIDYAAEAPHPDHGEQEEDLLAGSQPLAHLARGRRDRGPGRGAEGSGLHDLGAAGAGAEQGRVRRGRVQGRHAGRGQRRRAIAGAATS